MKFDPGALLAPGVMESFGHAEKRGVPHRGDSRSAAGQAACLGRTGRPGFAIGDRQAVGGSRPFPAPWIFRVGTFRLNAAGSRWMRPHALPLTRNEIARLFATLIIQPARETSHRLRWSTWRRCHQHRARSCHYQRQAKQP
jgi:hypothetical protein